MYHSGKGIYLDAHITGEELSGFIRSYFKKIGHFILNNRITEWLVVSIVGSLIVSTRYIDRAFHTKLNRAFVEKVHRVSRDELSRLRKTQIKHVFRRKYRLSRINIKLAGGSYWLSIPCIVTGINKKTKEEKKYLAKMLNERSTIKHRYMSRLRNLGVLVEGASLRFEDHRDAKEMLRFERDSLRMLRAFSIDTPEVLGMHKLNSDDYIMVMEFIEGKNLSKVELKEEDSDRLFEIIKRMHENGLIHGDVKLDNFIYSGGHIFVLDSLKIDTAQFDNAKGYDLMSAICALSQKMPVNIVIEHAKKYFNENEMAIAGSMLGVALNKADLDLSEDAINGLRKYFSQAS
jgi:tRNA A-37 threonylcarbamoyl transferase component Bud32